MNYGRRLQPNDSTSTYLLVKKLREEDFNIILIYKPQYRKVVIGLKTYDEIDVGKNLLTVDLKTRKQFNMFIKHSKGCPVGFFISDHGDKLFLRLFLEERKKRYPEDLMINTVMTDHGNNGWHAFINVFESVEHHFLCKWHITKA